MTNRVTVAPSARRLTNSLRDIGYSFESAVADLIDNSITAGASKISIKINYDGRNSNLVLTDNGRGMNSEQIDEAMRFGTRRTYDRGDLGRYGLGLKTASLSQCRRLEVVSLQKGSRDVLGRTLDLDFIQTMDDWIVLDSTDDLAVHELAELFSNGCGTVVTWKKLDRLLPIKSPESGWARRRIESLAPKLREHLAMVFHRFLSGTSGKSVYIAINGEPVLPWDPFCLDEPETSEFEPSKFEIEHAETSGSVLVRRFLLPSREQFTSRDSFDRAAGPEKWNKQQGLYIYRADRLVQWGGWAALRAIDEHTKLARVSLDFGTDLDSAFNINVAKMRVIIPSQLKKMIARPIEELCIEANAKYRHSSLRTPTSPIESSDSTKTFGNLENGSEIGMILKSAAVRTGNYDALKQISSLIKEELPDLAKLLGL